MFAITGTNMHRTSSGSFNFEENVVFKSTLGEAAKVYHNFKSQYDKVEIDKIIEDAIGIHWEVIL